MDGVAAGARSVVQRVIDNLLTKDRKGLVLTGGIGVGKTAILHMIRREFLRSRLARIDWSTVEITGESDLESFMRNNVYLINYRTFLSDPAVIVESHFELTKSLRKAVEKEEDPRELDAFILMIDDFGRGYDTDWNLALQTELFDHRWGYRLPTIITTNKTPEELRRWIDFAHIVDRLCDPSYSHCYSFGDGKSRRR